LVFVLDTDDETMPEYIRPRDGRELIVRRPEHPNNTGMSAALNAGAKDVLAQWPEERVLGFVGDDHRFRTPGWDDIFLESLNDRPGFVYGNDLFWKNGEIPTQIFMSAGIVKKLGWMALPTAHHLYLDNTWLELGQATGSIRYFADVVVEHMHPSGGKGQWDDQYRKNNSEAMYHHDATAFAEWRDGEQFMEDVKRVRQALVQKQRVNAA
jgi:hypothetical protein